MKGLSRLFASGAVVGLAGCGVGADAFLKRKLDGNDFNSFLARKYQELTRQEIKHLLEIF